MDRRIAAAFAVLVLGGPSVAAQSWTAPRTPWGDPDLQGDYTNKYEQGTPFERPAEFAGRRHEDFSADERRRLIRERAAEVLLNSPFTGGDPIAGNFGGAPAFYDRFDAARGSRLWLVADPPDGAVPAMTPEGRRASAARAAAAPQPTSRERADSYTDRSLYDRCITRGLPGSMMPANYGNSYRILQGPGYVAISYEMVHETRIVPLDGRAPVGPAVRQYMGTARGRWEGQTLVVETTNFRNESVYRGANPATLRLIERFTPTAPDTLEWSVTVDDPSSWPRPWTFAMPLTRNNAEAIFEYACHEGNRAMANLLSAARTAERLGMRADPAPVPAGDRPGGGSVGVAASEPEAATPLSGTWTLSDAGGRGNFAGFSPARRLAIRETRAAVVLETDTGTDGQAQRTTLRFDGSAADVPGPLGWDTKATAEKRTAGLDVRMTRTIEGPDGPLTFEIRDAYRVEGDTLILERTQGTQTRRMTYARAPR